MPSRTVSSYMAQMERERARQQREQARLEKEEQRRKALEEKERHKRYLEQRAKKAELDTIAAQDLLSFLENFLPRTIENRQVFSWEMLKDNRQFLVQEPSREPDSREPLSSDPEFRAKLNILDWFSSSKKSMRKEEARQRYESAHTAWQQLHDRLDSDYAQRFDDWSKHRDLFYAEQKEHNDQIDKYATGYVNRDSESVAAFADNVVNKLYIPIDFERSHEQGYDSATGTLIIDYALPPLDALPTLREVKYVKTRDEFTKSYITEAAKKKFYDGIVYQIMLALVSTIFFDDKADVVDALALNGWVESIDPATGRPVHACIVSLHATREAVKQIDFSAVEPRACFKGLRGVGSAQLHQLVPIAPIMQMTREDRRFVPGQEVLDKIEQGQNLAAIDWGEFENLVRDLFEKEFAEGGAEVRVTRASRDGGVDAVIFDPDPIRGGKIVIQAKRYTATVGLSVVRDLYGTVVNEGAIKGILVTTSDVGPDAYEFSKDKPISIINGGNLLYLLSKHGYKARIDLEEARRLNAASA